MKRPRRFLGQESQPELCVLIPCRNEEANLRRLLPSLLEPNPGLKVYVYDDESTDATAEVAGQLGAVVLRGPKLPPGWTGKNHACHQLAKAASEDSDAQWMLFLDADVYPQAQFIPGLRGFAASASGKVGLISGFPTILPGRGIEPLFLAWVGWSLLASNPFGLVSRVHKGHNRFTNGQVTLWRTSVYTQMWPNELLKGKVLEDVAIGRLLAKENIRLEIENLSSIMHVKMYETWRETLDGMSKNSYEITGSDVGTVLVALLLLMCGWFWLVAGARSAIPFGLLLLSGFAVAFTCKVKLWVPLLMPVVLSLGALTVLRSLVWRKRKSVVWKGRTYSEF